MRVILLILSSMALSLKIAIPDIPVLIDQYTELAGKIGDHEVVLVKNGAEALDALLRGEVDVAIGVPYVHGKDMEYCPLPVVKVKVGILKRGSGDVGRLRGWPGGGRVYDGWREMVRDLESGRLESVVGPYPSLVELSKKIGGSVEGIGKVVLRYAASRGGIDLRRAVLEFYGDVKLSEGMKDPSRLVMEVINFPPYEYFERGEWKGIDVEVVREILRRMGMELETVSFPPVRAFEMLKSGEIDGAFSLERTPEREKILYFPEEPISRGFDVLFYRKGERVDVWKLKGKTSGYVPGYVTEELLTSLGLTVFPVKDDELGMSLVSKGRIDVFMTNFLVGRFFMERNGIENLAWTRPVRFYDSYVAFSRMTGVELLAKEFERILKEFKSSPGYSRILEKYGLSREDIWAPPR